MTKENRQHFLALKTGRKKTECMICHKPIEPNEEYISECVRTVSKGIIVIVKVKNGKEYCKKCVQI